MIRQRNIDPGSALGIQEFERFGITFAVSTQRFGTPLFNVQRVKLIDILIYGEVAISGGGTNALSIRRNAITLAPSGGVSETVISTPIAADGGQVGTRRVDLSNLPDIDWQGALGATGAGNLIVAIVGSGTISAGSGGFKLRYRPYQIGKDV